MPLRETRRFKTKSFAFSFGDFMLPLVGLAAIGLLLVAGRTFLFSDTQGDNTLNIVFPDTRSTISPDTLRANAEERASVTPENQHSAVLPGHANQVAPIGGNLILDLARENETQNSAYLIPGTPNPNVVREEIVVVSTITPQIVGPEPTQPSVYNATNWAVQVGAFSTLAAAESVVQRAARANHTATVLSGRRWHRVLVHAGPTRQDAVALAARLGQTGFPGAFIIEP